MIVYNIILCSRFDQTGFVVIPALGKIGAHVFYKEITMKTRLACLLRLYRFSVILMYMFMYIFLVKNMNQDIVNRLQENVAELEQQVTNYTPNDYLTLDFQ